MHEHFTSSSHNYTAGRVWTLLTSAFSQSEPLHMLFNGLSFFWMAPGVLGMLGGAQFLVLYLGGALASSAVSLALDGGRPSLGASGACHFPLTAPSARAVCDPC
jgi:rhomboid-like protein